MEVQFQKHAEFYWEFVGEIFLYLSQYKPQNDWQAIAIFAKRSIEPEIPKQFRMLFDSGHIARIYLDELPDSEFRAGKVDRCTQEGNHSLSPLVGGAIGARRSREDDRIY